MGTRLKAAVIGGPIPQAVDDVLRLVPTGQGKLAATIAGALEKHFQVERIGNFPGGKPCDFSSLQQAIENLNANMVVFMAHIPNVLVVPHSGKIRLQPGEAGKIDIVGAPKLVSRIKRLHPEVLLVPFKIADQSTGMVEIIR